MSDAQSQNRISHEDALEAAFAGRLKPVGKYLEVPTSLFVGQIDIKMPPLPEIAFYILKGGKPELLRAADQPYSALALSANKTVLIQASDMDILKRYAQDVLLQSTLKNPPSTDPNNDQPNVRIQSLRRAAIKIMEEMFNSPTPENIKKGQRLVNSFVYVLMRDPKAYLLLARLRSHDPYTLQHSVGTAVNCIILARKLGVTDEVELNEVGLAGLLHDIGKTRVPKEIINKEGPLTDPEWAIMKKHSEYGWELIKDIPEIPERTKKAVLEHHEDKKGTGYPGGKTFDQIDLFSKIACISDIFNALTTNRSYSKARDVLSALTLMKDKLLYKIDEDMFKKLVKIYGGDFSDIPAITPSERPDSVAAQAKPKKAG